MIYSNNKELKDRIEEISGRRVYGNLKISEETREYMSVQGGMVWRMEDNDYYILTDAKEIRFGLDEQPKFWVKFAYDLTTGDRKVIKFAFHENIDIKIGRLLIKGYRNPEKEAAILDATSGHPHFMHGFNIRGRSESPIRVLDFIKGNSLFNIVYFIDQKHEIYFYKTLPPIMVNLVKCLEAMDFLHQMGHHHGDIRNDHIFIENDSGVYKWIDFDVMVNFSDFDLWSMGNILTYVVGKGIRTYKDVVEHREHYPYCKEDYLTPDDALQFYPYRIVNLKKLYPYIPDALNDILMHFAIGAENLYESFSDQIRDLKEAISACWPEYSVSPQ